MPRPLKGKVVGRRKEITVRHEVEGRVSGATAELAIRTLAGTLAILAGCATHTDFRQDSLSLCRRFHPPPQVTELISAARDGDTECQFFLGVYHYNGEFGEPDFEAAFHWFSTAAEQGHTDSEHHLGIMYALGKHVRPDQEKAVALYRKAAEKGSVAAQFDLAYRYHTGRGVEQNTELAMRWYRLAAEQGDERAAENLSILRSQGPGLQATAAFQRVLDGAAAGDPDAQWRLANIFAQGIPGHVRRDQRRALHWLREAAASGHEAAVLRLKELELR